MAANLDMNNENTTKMSESANATMKETHGEEAESNPPNEKVATDQILAGEENLSDDKCKESKGAAMVEDRKDSSESKSKEGNSNESEKGTEQADSVQVGNKLNFSDRRVMVFGIHKYLQGGKLRKVTGLWQQDFNRQSDGGVKIEIDKTKKPPKDSWVQITMKDKAMVQPFIEWMNSSNIRDKRTGRKLSAERVNEKDFNSKRKGGDSRGSSSKRARLGTDDLVKSARRAVTDEEVRDKLTPLWRMSSEEQLKTKMLEMVFKCAGKIVKETKQRFRELNKGKDRKTITGYDWIQKKRCIEVDDIIAAPTPLRNKCEFTFGYRYLFDKNTEDKGNKASETPIEDKGGTAPAETLVGDKGDTASKTTPTEDNVRKALQEGPAKVPAVGSMATGWAGGVSRPHCCGHIPSEACAIVDVVDNFLSSSPICPYDSKVHRGIWRTLMIRTSRRLRECQVIITHAPASGGAGATDGSDDCTEVFEKEKARLVSLLSTAELEVKDQLPLKITSIYFQEFEGLSNPTPNHPVQHAFGKKTFQERLGECTFQISPGAFFQVNTEGAELLYQLVVDKVREVSTEPEKTLLFDVCCGTGTIGLTCMKAGVVGQVVGVDISEPAIADAKTNAELNGFSTSAESKTRFVAARAEHVLSQEIGKAKKSKSDLKFVAVVDPAREGLHCDVVKTLRSNERIQRIVYVSCNPTATLTRDAALFCAPPTKRYPGRAFRVVSATPVDMFPLTKHCEMVMTFDRLSKSDIDGEMTSAKLVEKPQVNRTTEVSETKLVEATTAEANKVCSK